MGEFLRKAGGILISIPFLLLFLAMFLGPPVMVVLETIDLVRMNAQTQGRVDAVSIESGSKGTSRANITYHFNVGGRQVTSDRVFPGYHGSSEKETGGANVARDFPVGAQPTVYYSRRNPELCALQYGWSKWPMALTLFWCGLTTIALAAAFIDHDLFRTAAMYAGGATAVYGFGLIFFGPIAVRVRELHWHFLAWFGTAIALVIFRKLERMTTPERSLDSARRRPGESQQSTISLLLGLIFVICWTMMPMISGYLFLSQIELANWNWVAYLFAGVIGLLVWSGLRGIWGMGKELFLRFGNR